MRRRAWVLACVVMLGGCAPRPASLIESRNYNDVLCAVDDAMAPADRRLLEREFDDAVEPSVHVYPLGAAELGSAVGDEAASTLLKKAFLFRLLVQTNPAPVEHVRVLVSVLEGERPLDDVATRPRLAAILGETLPDRVRVKYGPQGEERMAEAVEDTAALAIPLLSLGLVQPGVSTRPNRGSYERPPTHAEYLAASPKTEILYQNLVADEGCGGPGTLCNDLVAVERPADESAPMALRFVVMYGAMGADGRHDRCELREEVRVALPSGGTLEARTRKLFADRVVRLGELR